MPENETNKRVYLNVPYKEKDIAKMIGAAYDGTAKKWYVPYGRKVELFSRWLPGNDATGEKNQK